MSSSPWSISLGCWSGVHVRLHVTLPLVMLCAFLMSEASIYTRASFQIERVILIVLLGFVAVAIHAASHVMAAARRGIETRELVLAPWGEFRAVEAPKTAEAELNTHLAGIMANSLLCVVSAIILWLCGDHAITEMLVPFSSRVLLEQNNNFIVIRWAFCLNYCLVIINLIPSSPFDGGRLFRAALQLLFPKLSNEAIRTTSLVTGRCAGLCLIGLAIALGQGDGRALVPAWFPLTVLGIIALFSFESPAEENLRERESAPLPLALTGPLPDEEPPINHRASAPEDLRESPFAGWMQERLESLRARRRELEQRDSERVDEILARLYNEGESSLTADDREVLQRVSDRLRRRQENRSES